MKNTQKQKNNWQTKKLGEVCDFQNGFAFKSKLFREQGSPVLRISNIQNDGISYNRLVFFDKKDYKENFDKYKALKGDLVIAMSGATTGKLAVCNADEIFYLNQRVGKFKPKGDLSNNYLYYFLSTKIEENLKISAGSAQPNLSTEQIKNLEIPLPPLPEQKRIVKVLDEVFENIEKAKENAEKNLKNSKELFESYLQNIFANPGKNWERRKIEECFKLKSGDGLTSKMMSKDGGYPVFGGNGIAGVHNKFNLSGSNVIIGRVGALCGNVRHITEKIWLTDNAFKVVDFKYDFDHSFLTYMLNLKNLRSYARQAAQPVISNSSLKDVVLTFPKSLSEQKIIVKKLDALARETKKLEAIYEQKLADLDELKKSVLKKAFNGEL
jgi:type I restriction enzyme S subunit